VLFLAHRAELLAQAAETFRRQFPESRFGWFVADRSNLQGDLVFASVQKLSKDKCLAQLQKAEPFAMSKSFKMVLLEALLEADALESGLSLEELARRGLDLLLRSPGLRRDIEAAYRCGQQAKTCSPYGLRVTR
jgi:hypothetical protein